MKCVMINDCFSGRRCRRRRRRLKHKAKSKPKMLHLQKRKDAIWQMGTDFLICISKYLLKISPVLCIEHLCKLTPFRRNEIKLFHQQRHSLLLKTWANPGLFLFIFAIFSIQFQ